MEYESQPGSAIPDHLLQEERHAMAAHFKQFVELHENPVDGTIGQLTTWQSDAFRAAGSLLLQQETVRGRLDIACGGGKTPIAIYLARALGAGQPRVDGQKRQLLLCTSRNGIVDQLSKQNTHHDEPEVLSDFQYFAPELRATVYNERTKDTSGDVVIMPYASLHRGGNAYPGKYSGYLLDECQGVGARTRVALQENAKGMPLFGLSATPGQSRSFLSQRIASISPLDGIMTHRFLSPTRLLGIETGQIVQRRNTKARNFHSSDIAPLAVDPYRMDRILEVVRFSAAHLGPGWIRCHANYRGYNHAAAVAEMVNASDPIIDANGVERRLRVEAVSRSRKNSADIIEEFMTTDNIDALTYVKLIGEGYNIPKFRWGLWTPPTLSYDSIEQAIGRGNRRDNEDKSKVFTFFQLVDTAIHARDHLALGWEIFGVDREVRNTVTISPSGISIGEASHDDQLKAVPIPEFLKRSIERTRTVPLHALDIAATPMEPGKAVHSLTKMQAATGLDRNWMRQILFHGEFGGTAAFDLENNDEIDFFYEEEALGFLLDAVAQPGDQEIGNATDSLGISERRLRELMQDYGFDFTYLYSYVPTPWCVPRLHVRRKIFEILRDHHGERRDLLESEMSMAEVSERTGLTQGKLGPYLETRGFSLWRVKVKGRAQEDVVGSRKELTPWIRAYIRAPQPPTKGFAQLAQLCRLEFDGRKPHLSEVFAAAKQAGVKTWIFRLRTERKEYVELPRKQKVINALERIVKNRAETPEAEIDESYLRPIRNSIKASDKAIMYHAKKLGIPLHGVPSEEDSERIKQSILAARRDLTIFEDEPALMEAVTGVSRSQEWLQKVVVHATVAISDAHGEDQPDFIPKMNPRVVTLIAEKHPTVSRYPFTYTKDGAVVIDTTLKEMLNNVIARSNIKSDIPLSWEYVGDIAQHIGAQERDLTRFLVAKNLPDSAIRYVELVDTRGVMAFCSPELAKKLKTPGRRPRAVSAAR